ncbi:MAG: hypothetical protein ABR928_02810 [Terracidiphilus sp.]|jgi:hypothetical protein
MILKSLKCLPALSVLVFAIASQAASQANVRIEPPAAQQGPRELQEQTASAAIRDYLQSWQSLSAALKQNRSDLLSTYFAGTALDKLGETMQEQVRAGLSTGYKVSSHDIQIVFYSPEGLSIELTDTVEYDMKVLEHGKLIANQHMRTRYIAVLTPAVEQWKVRVFQAMN